MDLPFIEILVPNTLSVLATITLVVISAVTSFISAAFGLGGGVVLLACMASLLPASALIPVHGLVQIGSNAGRAAVLLPFIKTTVLFSFATGSICGALLGGMIVVRLPDFLLYFGLSGFVLWAALGRRLPKFGYLALLSGGAISSFLTMFFGATGPFVAAIIKGLKFSKFEHVATFSACMVAQHTIKVLIFGFFGFLYGPYAGLIVAMIISGFVGTLLGRRLLQNISDKGFQRILTIILMVLAVRLFWQGLVALSN